MKQLLFAAILVLVIGSLAISQTLPKMATTDHDFRYSGPRSIKGASDNLCGYCHTPHVPAGGINTPLWARAKTTTTGYGVYTSTSMDATPTSVVGGSNDNNSSMCMSCHDGSVLFASAAYAGLKRPSSNTGISWTTTGFDTLRIRDSKNLYNGVKYGAGLQHTHPVNFLYSDATGDPGIHPVPVATDSLAAAAPLYDGYVQCGSCHDPHLTGKFIRISMTNSALCISCHNK
jgi:predicted CXXCH cytochrome family protein